MSILFDPTLYTVPPENCTEREAEVYELLSRLGIKFTRVSHEPAMTIEDCVEIDELLGVPMCKISCFATASRQCFSLLCCPVAKRISSSVLAKAIGAAQISFAPDL